MEYYMMHINHIKGDIREGKYRVNHEAIPTPALAAATLITIQARYSYPGLKLEYDWNFQFPTIRYPLAKSRAGTYLVCIDTTG